MTHAPASEFCLDDKRVSGQYWESDFDHGLVHRRRPHGGRGRGLGGTDVGGSGEGGGGKDAHFDGRKSVSSVGRMWYKPYGGRVPRW